jgi:hypothetical protein
LSYIDHLASRKSSHAPLLFLLLAQLAHELLLLHLKRATEALDETFHLDQKSIAGHLERLELTDQQVVLLHQHLVLLNVALQMLENLLFFLDFGLDSAEVNFAFYLPSAGRGRS